MDVHTARHIRCIKLRTVCIRVAQKTFGRKPCDFMFHTHFEVTVCL